MKRTEITGALVAGVTDFAAVLSYGGMRQGAAPESYPEYDVARVRIVKVHDKDPNGYSTRGEKNRIVEYRRVEGGQVGESEYAPVRRIIATWDGYTEARRLAAERAAQWARERDLRTANLKARSKRLRERQEHLDLTGKKWGAGDPVPMFDLAVDEQRGTAKLYFHGSTGDVERLLDRLDDALMDRLEAGA